MEYAAICSTMVKVRVPLREGICPQSVWQAQELKQAVDGRPRFLLPAVGAEEGCKRDPARGIHTGRSASRH